MEVEEPPAPGDSQLKAFGQLRGSEVSETVPENNQVSTDQAFALFQSF